ncbi:MAG: lactate utilization protein [Bacteroides sp.]|nr:lactate utilization protein [Bacteroides sp.]MCM1380093.1 lactate utilization protein [Bacteroides sp.]MCM1445674.1 lactate utilization protein [Prevotella sp.]
MNTRNEILNKLRTSGRELIARPQIHFPKVAGDAIKNFAAKLTAFDGRAILFPSREDAIAWFEGTIDRNRHKIYSSVPGVESLSFTDPHAANVVDVCLTEGLLGVGETGSVWVTDKSLGLTAAALFCTDLYLLLDSTKIVDGIHTAYRTINPAATPYGSFFTGPSATADIEAIHISGAQAYTSLTVLLY